MVAPTRTAARGLRAGLADAGTLALAGLLANGANVVVTVALARLLSGRGYGAFAQLTGVFLVVSMPGSALVVAVVRRATAHGDGREGVRRWAAAVHRRGLVALALFAVVVGGAGPGLAALLGRSDPWPIDAMAVAGGVWVLVCVDRGLLQARRAYRQLSANFLTEGILRTAFVLALVAAGLGVLGAALGVCAGEVGTALAARRAAHRAWGADAGSPPASAPESPPARARALGAPHAWRDLAAALAALGALALLQNVDVLVMGRERPGVAGAYGAVSVSCKALVFAALVVAGYLLPEAAIRWRDGSHALRQLALTLGLLAVPAAGLVVVGAALSRPFLRLVFSARYLRATGAFLPLALAMACLAATVVVTMYLLAIGRRAVTGLLVAGALACTGAVALAHGDPRTTAFADLAVQACVLAASAAVLVAAHSRRAAGAPVPAVATVGVGAGGYAASPVVDDVGAGAG